MMIRIALLLAFLALIVSTWGYLYARTLRGAVLTLLLATASVALIIIDTAGLVL
jgi:hypothetical protein